MKTVRESIDMEWMAPLEADLPTAVLYGAVLTIAHTASMIPWESVRQRLRSNLGGNPRERKTWRGVEMTWDSGKVPMKVHLNRRRVKIQALRRWTPSKFRRLMRSLSDWPMAGKMHLHAQVEKVVASDFQGPRAPRLRKNVKRPHWMDTAERFNGRDS